MIPALNAFDTLSKLLPAVKAHIEDVLVVDDGSVESDPELASRFGVKIIRHERTRGKGAALKTGFAYALDNSFDSVITIDSDGQHDPAFIRTFLRAFEKTGSELIIGSRLDDRADMPLARRFSNTITSKFLSLILQKKIEDSQCGYRLISRRVLAGITLESDHFELETEIIIKAVRAGFNLEFLPIRVLYGKQFPTHISGPADTVRWCRLVLKLIGTKTLRG